MTRPKRISIHLEDALQHLYGDEVRNLTPEGYQEHMNDLRDRDPALAKRIEGALRPLLQKFFPRRQVKWHETSEGMRLRVALLPDNVHVKHDVETVRTALGLPQKVLEVGEETQAWQDLKGWVKRGWLRPERLRYVVEGDVGGRWLSVHTKAAAGGDVGEEEAETTKHLFESAVAASQVDFSSADVDWLRRAPSAPDWYCHPLAPIDWAAGRLVERHRLPWRATTSLKFYILTRNPEWLTGLSHLHVEVQYADSSQDPEAFSVTVKRIDEFFTKADWDSIWKGWIRPRQKDIWTLRGTAPQGKHGPDLERLRQGLPFYGQVLETQSFAKALCQYTGELDQETLRRRYQDIYDLLKPAE